jgi:hypothetical protein
MDMLTLFDAMSYPRVTREQIEALAPCHRASTVATVSRVEGPPAGIRVPRIV